MALSTSSTKESGQTISTKETGSSYGKIKKINSVFFDLLAGIIFIVIAYFIFF